MTWTHYGHPRFDLQTYNVTENPHLIQALVSGLAVLILIERSSEDNDARWYNRIIAWTVVNLRLFIVSIFTMSIIYRVM